jgi:hypothetical protein
MIKGIEELPKEVHGIFNYGNMDEVAKNFVKVSNDPIAFTRAFQALARRRKDIYSKFRDEVSSVGEIERDCIRYYKDIDFLPKESCLEKERIFLPTSIPLTSYLDCFNSVNPRVAYLRHLFPDKFRETDAFPNPLPLLHGGGRTINVKATVQERRIDEEKMPFRSRIDRKPINEFAFWVDDDLEDAYINPQMVMQVADQMKLGKISIPRYIPEEKKELIEFRKMYGFTSAELSISWGFKWEERFQIKQAIGNLEGQESLIMEFAKALELDNEANVVQDDVVEPESLVEEDEDEPVIKEIDFKYLEELDYIDDYDVGSKMRLCISDNLRSLDPTFQVVLDYLKKLDVASRITNDSRSNLVDQIGRTPIMKKFIEGLGLDYNDGDPILEEDFDYGDAFADFENF